METIKNSTRRHHGFCFGLILILSGIILLGLNFGYIPQIYKNIIFSWPALVILIGLLHFRKRHQLLWGFIWIIVGTFFLLPKIFKAFPDNFPGVSDNFTTAYWPLLLICAGLIFILFRFFAKKTDWYVFRKNKAGYYRKSTDSLSSDFEKNTIFGSGEHIILNELFTGGELNSIFSGVTLDLRRTNLPEGDTVLEINAVFGGVTLYIPGDWTVVAQMDTVFGGFEDKRRIIEPIDSTRRLLIKGACVFGGGEIIS